MKSGPAVAPEHDYEPEYDSRRPYGYTGARRDSEGNWRPRMAPWGKMPMEFDQHGAELGKDARFWKVYVKEADDWDEELVHGWNK
ncbi:hypothetical protein FRC11_008223 [Ceratobasidium sp. 423]|nr:hypothetical protein FRC11_008223 [Ceratobasidium sp. 423]